MISCSISTQYRGFFQFSFDSTLSIILLLCYFLLNFDRAPGFFESRKACYATGTIETSFLCNANSVGTSSNDTQYVIWDGFHPSETAYEKLAQCLLEQGFDLIS